MRRLAAGAALVPIAIAATAVIWTGMFSSASSTPDPSSAVRAGSSAAEGSPIRPSPSDRPSQGVGTPGPVSIAPTASPASANPRLQVSVAAWSLPAALSRSAAFASGRSVVLAGGLGTAGTVGTIERIAVGDGRSTIIGRLPDPVHDAGGAVLGLGDLVIGGGRTTQDGTVQRVSTDGHATVIGTLPARRADLVAVAVGDRVIVVGGGAAGRADPAVLATTDGVRFRMIASLPLAVRYPAVAELAGRVWLVGGTTSAGDTRVIQVVDPRTGAAWIAGRLPRALSHATAVVLGGRLFVAGGRHAGAPMSTILEIDPTSGRARIAGRLPRASSDAAGVVLAGVGYLLGGESSGPLATVVELRLD